MEHSMAERLKELEARKAEARVAGGEKAIERHRAKGRMTARERLEYLLDEDSFQELDMLNRHVASGMGLEESRPYTDGVITGYGKIDGRKVCVYSQDFTVFGGALGETHGEKIHKIMDLATTMGLPIIGLNDGAGARIQEGVAGLNAYGGIFRRNARASGVVPQISVILGPVRRRGGVLAGPDRLHLHGEGHEPHVHHRSRRGEGRYRRGRHARRARRRPDPRHQVGRGDTS